MKKITIFALVALLLLGMGTVASAYRGRGCYYYDAPMAENYRRDRDRYEERRDRDGYRYERRDDDGYYRRGYRGRGGCCDW